jgi:hypothetical protein
MKEQRLNELQGASRLTLKFYNRLIRRIECTKPLAGNNISIKEDENGFTISAPTAAASVTFNPQQITLNVCSNGVPSTIVVYGP